MRSSCWATWRSRTADSARRWRRTAGWWRTIPTTPSRWCIPILRSIWRGWRPRSSCAARPRARTRPARRISKDFATRYPGASGTLAGRTGAYAEILAESLGSDHLGPAHEPDNRWPTFAGSFQRTKVVPGPIDVGSMQWRVDLEKVSLGRGQAFNPRGGFGGRPVTAPPERLLAFHPIVLGDQVIVCDGTRVLAYNLNDRPPADTEASALRLVGPVWKYPADDDLQVPQARHSSPGIPRYTLTAFGNRIYARMGSQSAAYSSGMGSRGSSSIVALDWSTQGKLLWEQRSTTLSLPNRPPDRNNNRTVSFEGTPVADGDSVYVAVTDRREQTATYVACFDADTGAVRWIRYLGAASPDGDNNIGFMGGMQASVTSPGDFNHRLLSLDGPDSLLPDQSGRRGRARGRDGLDPLGGDLSPPGAQSVRQRQRARPEPGDRSRRPGLRRAQRRRVRSSRSTLGAAGCSGRPIRSPTTSSSPTCWASPRGGWSPPAIACCSSTSRPASCCTPGPTRERSLDGYGRGLLAGDLIYWPTQNEIQILDQRTGLRAEPPIKLQETYHTKGGNLVAGDGYLIVAQADGLVVFCQNSRLIERYREEIARAPDEAANYFRLARAAEAIGRDQLALENVRRRRSRRRGRPRRSTAFHWSGAARDHQFRLLLRLAGSGPARPASGTRPRRSSTSAGKVARSDARAAAGPALARRRPARRVAARATRSPSASGSWPTIGCGPWPSPPPTAIAPSGPIS